jgi:cytochrome P450
MSVRDSMGRIPFATDSAAIGADPMAYLDTWRRRLGDIYALDIDGPLLSQSPDCTGVIAVFGAAYQHTVLTDIERFVLPISAAVRLGLPRVLQNLNSSIQGKVGDEHKHHKQLLSSVLSRADIDSTRVAAEQAVDKVHTQLREKGGGGLLAHMRDLTLHASSNLLFGNATEEVLRPHILMTYFQQRRAAAVPGSKIDSKARSRLIKTGEEVDRSLRAYRRAVRSVRDPENFGVLASLAIGLDDVLDEDSFVGHANILFVSCNEPVAVALFWTLLALSQLPDLRMQLRVESSRQSWRGSSEGGVEVAISPLLEAVLRESLRLLTPNALMVRVTNEPVALGTYLIPARCEVILAPFLSHRDPVRFPQPDRFSPSRWKGLRTSPYEYFPFGAGGHGCVGRMLAWRLMHSMLAALIRRGDIVLDSDTEVDWYINIMLMPTKDPLVRISAAETVLDRDCPNSGRLSGGVTEIIALSQEWL